MSFSEETYIVSSYYGSTHILTAKELFEKVMSDSLSDDYNWFAPTNQIVNVCKKPTFPEKYSVLIRSAILNRFTNIARRANTDGKRYYIDSFDRAAIDYCFNSLFGIKDENAIAARTRFLKESILVASQHYSSDSDFERICEEWKKNTLYEYLSLEYVDCLNLVGRLRANFFELVNTTRAVVKISLVDCNTKKSTTIF